MLIDLPRWKAARLSEQAQAVLDEHSDRCINVDQDALNIVGVGNWSVLPPRWNFQVAGSRSWSVPPAPGETIRHHAFHQREAVEPQHTVPPPGNVR
jgi:lipopolysaccharide biosynthesis glycosyltransferase